MVSVPVDTEPLVAFVPDHAPEAAQLVAFVLVHVSVELPPLATDAGLAVSETVGAAASTVIVADAEVLPPLPLQLSPYVLVILSAPVDDVPLVAFVPNQAPEAVQLVAFVVLHISVELPPLVTNAGVAVSTSVGAAGGMTVIDADTEVLPPAPEHVRV